MKKFKIIALMLVLVFSLQCVAFASESTIQPRGRYLLGGGCSITPYSGYVEVNGHTDAYEEVDELIVELTLFRVMTSGAWIEIWSNTYTGYDDIDYFTPAINVNVEPGCMYAVEATHTVKHNGVTETNYSEAGPVSVFNY